MTKDPTQILPAWTTTKLQTNVQINEDKTGV